MFIGAGEFLASRGATEIAGIAYVSPSSQAGLGSTHVGPLVLGILESGDDAVCTTINFDTSPA